jgi:hypothetical protein
VLITKGYWKAAAKRLLRKIRTRGCTWEKNGVEVEGGMER